MRVDKPTWRAGVNQALGWQWTPYATALTAVTTAPTGWTTTGGWYQVGSLVVLVGRFQAQTGMTTGSGTYRAVLPVPASTLMYDGASTEKVIGSGGGYDLSTGATQAFYVSLRSATVVHFGYTGASAPAASPTTPWTWAAGDSISFSLTYEAALPT